MDFVFQPDSVSLHLLLFIASKIYQEEECRTNIFIKSSCDFLGMMVSICGASSGYVSQTLLRTPRCTEDFSFDF